MEKLLKRAESKKQSTIDMLVISGGGDWGAFGAGVLKGWGRVQGEMARPQFDVVTGVSTGAMIAPLAFLGDDESIERIVQMYRKPQKDWAVTRGLLFFLPNNPSFYSLPGLEREVRTALDRPTLERIAAEDASNRGLVVNTTNIDLGDMHAWDIVAETKAALARNDEAHVHRILLASAGIPGAFPSRGIGPFLYVDGAITGNILYGGRTREGDGLPALWKAKHPGVPVPRMRVLGHLQQPVPLSSPGHAGALARHHDPRDDHVDADLHDQFDAPPLRDGRDREAQVRRGHAGARHGRPGRVGAAQAGNVRGGGDEQPRRSGRKDGRRPGKLAHRGAVGGP